MNKIKLAFIATAILAGVGGAFATRPCVGCEYDKQYYQLNNGYAEAGTYGVDFYCMSSGGVCTFFKPDPGQPNMYVPCKTGTFAWINASDK